MSLCHVLGAAALTVVLPIASASAAWPAETEVAREQEQPSLAAAASASRVPMDDELPSGNPAAFYCADLGGSSRFGNGAAGGGWVSLDVVRGVDLLPLFCADVKSYSPIVA